MLYGRIREIGLFKIGKRGMKREKAWKCWLEIINKLNENQCYMEKGGDLHISRGCGGDFVDIIQKYL